MALFRRAPVSAIRLYAAVPFLLAALFASPAFSHATLEVTNASANTYFKATIRVAHGCESEPTNTLTVKLPEGFIGAKPMPKPGWTVETVKAKFARSYELQGRKTDEGVTQIRWTGGSLDTDHYDEFILRGRITEFAPGTRLAFPVVQTCTNGEVRWDQIASEGQEPYDLKLPAPLLTIEAVNNGHSHYN